jgi:MoaA/NifB/PqqE/SkfB family radical SAM enzyme
MREVTAQGMNLIVTTNGLLFDATMLDELRAIEPLDVRVSFDGGPRFHDQVRGKGTYQGALAGLASLIHAGIPATARLTLCRGGEDELPALFDDIRAIGATKVKVALAKPSGRAATSSGRHLVVDAVDPVILKNMEDQCVERGLRLQLAADDFEVEVTDGSLSKLRDIDRPNCGAGYETCHITPRGELLACAAIRNLPFGTLQTLSFLEAWEGHIARRYRERAGEATTRRLCDAIGDPSAAAPIPLRRKTQAT